MAETSTHYSVSTSTKNERIFGTFLILIPYLVLSCKKEKNCKSHACHIFPRFILSLASCKTCVVIDDQLNILPISSHVANIKPVPPKTQVSLIHNCTVFCFPSTLYEYHNLCCCQQDDGLSPREQELKDLKESLQDTQPVGVLVDGCKTMDQV